MIHFFSDALIENGFLFCYGTFALHGLLFFFLIHSLSLDFLNIDGTLYFFGLFISNDTLFKVGLLFYLGTFTFSGLIFSY